MAGKKNNTLSSVVISLTAAERRRLQNALLIDVKTRHISPKDALAGLAMDAKLALMAAIEDCEGKQPDLAKRA
jgi:hypothetical protein